MLRTGLDDDDIIAALAGKQLVNAIGPTQAASLRGLGAGAKLLNNLQTRPLYAAPLTAQAIIVSAPVLPRAVTSSNVVSATPRGPATPPPVDEAAKDRQIKNLQSQIDAIDARILQIRSHPESLSLFGTYNGRGVRDGDESPLKKILDQLDKQRNDLRRQKWQLEGR